MLQPPQIRKVLFLGTWRRQRPLKPNLAAYINPNARENTPLLVAELDNRRSIRSIEDILWVTYVEAREVIRSVDRKRARERAMRPDARDNPQILSGHFRNGQRELTLTYSSEKDVICFESRDLKNILHWVSHTRMPPFIEMGFFNFALPYHKSWADFYPVMAPSDENRYHKRRTMDGIIFRACARSGAQHFWVIDRVPRPKEERRNEYVESHSKIFGYRERYLPVSDRTHWDLRGSKSFEFMDRLKEAVLYWKRLVIGNRSPLEYSRPPTNYGVLCCVE
ncbi:hypothetical protein HDV62DRAFT_66298 [Trichoderma sp. SZMC 28011]